jgi:hypothetical protein
MAPKRSLFQIAVYRYRARAQSIRIPERRPGQFVPVVPVLPLRGEPVVVMKLSRPEGSAGATTV